VLSATICHDEVSLRLSGSFLSIRAFSVTMSERREKRKLNDGAGVEQRVPTRCGQPDNHPDSLLAMGRTWKRSHVYAQNTRFSQYKVHDMTLARLRVRSLQFSTLCKTTAK
jgi:hypothetical protein